MTANHSRRHHRDRAVDEDPRRDARGKRHSRDGVGVGGAGVVDRARPTRRRQRRWVVASAAVALLLMAVAGGASSVGGGVVVAVVAVEGGGGRRAAGGGGEEFATTTTTGRRLQDADAAATNETEATATAAEEEEEEGDHAGEEDHEGEEEHAGEDEHEGEEEEAYASTARPYGAVIGATLLVNVATLSGVLLVMCGAIRGKPWAGRGGQASLFDLLVYSFAAGALLATAVFLVLPEAMELIKGGHGGEGGGGGKSESVATAQFGCAFLGGFLLPLLLAILFHVDDVAVDGGPLVGERDDTASATDDTGVAVSPETAETTKTTGRDEEGRPETAVSECSGGDVAVVKPVYNRRLIASIILGDSLHNFADGMFIAASFMGCDISLALTVVAMTLVHEVAQEIGDFVLLTRHGGLSVLRALCLNFVSGMSVVLGGVVFLAASPSDESAGIILAIAAGVYVNIATVETLPRIEAIVKTRMDRFWTLFGVILGTVPIGLVLLNHKHCS